MKSKSFSGAKGESVFVKPLSGKAFHNVIYWYIVRITMHAEYKRRVGRQNVTSGLECIENISNKVPMGDFRSIMPWSKKIFVER